MKTSSRLLPLMLSLMMLISVFAIPAYAANVTDIDIIKFEAPISGTTNKYKRIPGRKKQDYSAAYLFVTAISNNYVRVRAYGQLGTSSTDCSCNVSADDDPTQKCSHKQNCTYWDGAWAPYVQCKKMVKGKDNGYSINNLVKEWKWNYISLGFQSANTSSVDKVTGWWSADSGSPHDVPLGP